MTTATKRLIYTLILSTLSMPSLAAWELNAAQSSFHYVTSKVSAVSEVNTFNGLSGDIDDSGLATLLIDLASVDTAVAIRNERVQAILFEVEQYPSASVSINVDPANLHNLATGASETKSFSYSLNLHGIESELSTDLTVTKLSDDRLSIQPSKPIILNADSFGLGEGVEALREIAGLASINHNVVIDFSLTYDAGM